MNVAYIRVNTLGQKEDMQNEALKKYNIDKWYTDRANIRDINKPGLKAMLDFVHEGDILHIYDFSRIASSTKELIEVVDYLDKKNVCLVSEKEKVDSSTSDGKIMLTMLSAITNLEKQSMVERQRASASREKHRRNTTDRRFKPIDGNVFNATYERYNNCEITQLEFANILGVSRSTLTRLLKNRVSS